MKISVIGDLHLKPLLTYADYIEDKREGEVQEILDFIFDNSKLCDAIVFMGDLFNSRNNQSEVIRRLVSFIERFSGKEIYIIAGNHEKSADGSSALDFLSEIKNPLWHIFTDQIGIEKDMVFCPYFKKQELECTDNHEATQKLLEKLPVGTILFAHHAFSQSYTDTGSLTDTFDEVVLPREELEKKYKLCVGGHIHAPQNDSKFIVTGSIFVNEMNEKSKQIFTIDTDSSKITSLSLPGRVLQKLENPTLDEIKEFPKKSILKVVLTDPAFKEKEAEIKKALKRVDGFMLLEQFPGERKKTVLESNLLDFSVEEMLEVYAKQKQADTAKLKRAFNLLK